MGKTGRIIGGVGGAALVAITSWVGLAPAHADGCVYDGNLAVCGPQRDGVEPGTDGFGQQVLFSANHWGPVGLPARDDGTAASASQWWSTYGNSQWKSTDIGAGVNPNATVAHSYLDGFVHQFSYRDGVNEQRQTYVGASTGSWDGPTTPAASVNAQQNRWSPAPGDCDTDIWSSVSAGNFNNNPSLYNLGCPVDVPEFPTAPPGV